MWDSEEKEYLYLKEVKYNEEHSLFTVVNMELTRTENVDRWDVEKVQADINLNDDTLYTRTDEDYIDKYEEVLGDSMDALEDYYKH
ncbi:hypothetical protein AALF85_05755 [Jeotgalicoccus halotolerans]|uniref:hypothetical protein n=1 Tax=Jeotgalicoccus halotolerans TaxID=157227 RepID=UPI0035155B4B